MHPDMVSEMLQNSTTCTFICNNLYLCSTRHIYIQHFIFQFNNMHFLSTSTKNNFIQQKSLFTSTKDNYIQQKYLFNFNPNYFHSAKIIIQLQTKIISFNNKVRGHSKYCHSTKFPVWSPVKYTILRTQSPITRCLK